MALLKFRGICLEDFEQLEAKDPDTRYLVLNPDGSVYGEYIGDKLIGTAERIKQLYEANPDTNAFTDLEKAKLSGIEEGAQVNTVSPEDLDAPNIRFDGSGTNFLAGETDVEGAIEELDTRVKTNADNVVLKVNTSDIVDNLVSTDADKPLSANQGKVLKDAVDVLDARVDDLESEAARLDNEIVRVEQKADAHIVDVSNPHGVTKAQVGLSEVDNIKQATKTEFDAHKDNKNNPHGVTAEQVGTYDKTTIDNKDANTLQEAKAYTYSKVEIDNKDAVVLQEAKDYTDVLGADVLELQGKVEDIEDGTAVVKRAEQDEDGNSIKDTYATLANLAIEIDDDVEVI